ncbi:hypothetical protein B0H10DRAFT_2208882 [Mycena sp. CBHHK59/15]|nr:hypothetical protein B0H10DRAFT_2208882 [Mycena sp. CBHHK59/15]
MFPRLENLHFEPIRTRPGDFPSADIPMPPHLHTLQLKSLRSHERWFADNRVSSLSTLRLSSVRPVEDIPLLDEMLEIFGTNIRHLTLHFANQKGQFFHSDYDLNVNLTHTTQLRTLEIDLSELTRRHIFPTLSSLRAPHIEKIVWRNRRAFDFSAGLGLWSDLDVLLADRNLFPTLYVFLIKAPGSSEDMFNPKQYMPVCDALGLLAGEKII